MYIIIAGGGKVGSYLAHLLVGKGHDVAVIEQDVGACEALSDWGKALVINGDCCDLGALIDAGIEKTDRFAAVTGDDADNLVACQLAKVRFNVPLTTARINDPRNEDIFHKFGVDLSLIHISEPTRLGMISYAVFCLKKKKKKKEIQK